MNADELLIDRYYLNRGEVFVMTRGVLADILDCGGEYNFEPIPLTHEWLHDFGFVSQDMNGGTSEWFIPKMRLFFSITEVNGEFCFNHKVEIASVHHLQNMFFDHTFAYLIKLT